MKIFDAVNARHDRARKQVHDCPESFSRTFSLDRSRHGLSRARCSLRGSFRRMRCRLGTAGPRESRIGFSHCWMIQRRFAHDRCRKTVSVHPIRQGQPINLRRAVRDARSSRVFSSSLCHRAWRQRGHPSSARHPSHSTNAIWQTSLGLTERHASNTHLFWLIEDACEKCKFGEWITTPGDRIAISRTCPRLRSLRAACGAQ